MAPPSAGDETVPEVLMTGETLRTVLFLQGPPSSFWAEVADAFEAAGHRTLRVNLCGGDLIYWRRKGALNYRGRFRNWRSWLADLCKREGVTDILYYADRLPYHIEAKGVARELGIRAYACEFGYLRPDWLTLEHEGMGVYSHFPDDPAAIRGALQRYPATGPHPTYPFGFNTEAVHEVTFNLGMEFLRVLYPFYRSDKYYHPYVDYLSWLPRLFRTKRNLTEAEAHQEWLLSSKTPYFLLPLQLQSDYQIRANSPYMHLTDMLDEVIGSFARNAPAETHLVVKVHPLDNGLVNWSRAVERIARRHGATGRVKVIDGGNLAKLTQNARGMIVVNSTSGMHALRLGCPVKVLGIAVFDIAGLTHQGPLSSFWTRPEPVSEALCRDLVRMMEATVQVKGSFYNRDGRKVAAAEIVRRVTGGLINQPGAHVDPPPRIAKALKLGIPVDR